MRILGEAPVRTVAMHFDPAAWCTAHAAAKRSGVFSELLSHETAAARERNDLASSLQDLSGDAMRVVLIPWLRQQVAAVLRLDVERIPVDKPMRSLGLDSLMALELRNRLERSIHLKFSATLVWNYPTVSAVATHLEERLTAARSTAPEAANALAMPGAPKEEAVPSKRGVDREGTGSATDMLEAELLGAEDLLNTLGSAK
jgi:acyl carrier protein